MAVRLQMKLGVIAEPDRVSDSPDTVVVVEPSVGSVARSKGNLYLIVTSTVASQRAQEATQLAAETIRSEYYYDESAGIRVCLEKAIAAANKRLAHQRDRLNLQGDGTNGPIGIGVAVVRGNELYVGTIGPAEAYLIRQARLSTLPDPHRERGLPTQDLEPDVWRGEISVGDSLVLISPNVMARLGPDELKDAMVTLHPQSAMEHLHHRFAAADGSGSDGAIAFEATEVASTSRQRTLVPVRPAEPLAGAPDRSPIPLADPVAGGVAAVQASARQARSAAGNAFERAVVRLQDFLPQRRTAYRRVTPMSARRETQRRAAVAVLAFIVVLGGLGMAVFLAGGRDRVPDVASSLTAGQRALNLARDNIERVDDNNLITTAPERALELLTEAHEQLDAAQAARMPASVVDPLRARVVAQLDDLYRVVDVADAVAFSFTVDANTTAPIDLQAIVRGPDGAPYVLDRTTRAVWRINVAEKRATAVIREGTEAAGAVAAAPRLLTAGGQDVLVLDERNIIWRFRPADDTGVGALTRVPVLGAAEWGTDVIALGTYLRIPEQGLYNLYVIDPSAEQILRYSPSGDGSGFPAPPSGFLSSERPVGDMSSLFIDGDVFVAEGGELVRFVSGNSEGWEADEIGDTLLREEPRYTIVTATAERRAGILYAYDAANGRVVAFDKATGDYLEQYRLAGDREAWAALRGMYVVPGADGDPPVMYWIGRNALHRTVLEAVEVEPDGSAPPRSPAPSPSGGASGAPPSAQPAP